MSDWIKTSEQAPEEGELVLIWGGSFGDVRIGQIDSDLETAPRWVDQEFYDCDQPTHWMRIPAPPTE